MSHVDEGALHAYLDGALDELPAAEAAEIRIHLDACAECVARLEHERAVRAEAHAVLGLATPDVEMPTLEDLRAYVQRTRPPARSGAGVRMARVGWAASIVFAVGAGWMLRDGQLRPDGLVPESVVPEAGVFEARARAATATVEQQEAETGDAQLLEAEVADVMEEAVREQAAPTVAAASPPATPVTETAEAFADAVGVSSRAVTGDAAEAAAGAGVARLVGSTDVTAVNRMVAAERADVLMTVPSEPAAVTSGSRSVEATPELDGLAVAVVPLAARAGAAAGQAADDQAGQAAEETASEKTEPRRTESVMPVTSAIDQGRLSRTIAAVDEDRRIDEEPALAVPGYDVVSVTNFGEGTTAIGAHVLQRFDGPTTFEIFHLEPGVDPSVVPPAAQGDREVRVESEAGWVVLRGPLDDDTLGVLLTLLFPG